MTKFKAPLRFALSLLPIAAVGGIFTGFYQMDISSAELVAAAAAQLGGTEALIAVVAVQTVAYSLFCGFFGYILADKLGLWRPVRFEKRQWMITLAVSIVGGIVFSLDYWTFGAVIDGIQSANRAGNTANGVVASVLYGGVIEEVMLRLFFLSLVAFVIWKLFFRQYSREQIPETVFVLANIAAAFIFAAGHLPATVSVFGELTPLLVFRCFLLNGGFALVFGWLYRKYGIVHAMFSHAAFHVVSKLIWLIFV